MKRLLLILLAGVVTQASIAQSVCNPSFSTTSLSSGNNLLRLQVNNTSTWPSGNKTTSFHLNWGDGSAAHVGLGNAYHNYTSPGTYIVTLNMTVWDSLSSQQVLNCMDSVKDTVTIAYTPCGTTFTISGGGTSSSTVTVTANTPAGSSGVSYTWNWGDGTANSTGNPATHTYTTNGTKPITLTAVKGSCTHQNIDSVLIGTICNSAKAMFSFSQSGQTINFTSTASNLSSTTKRYNWDFGDGNFSLVNTSPITSHAYTSAGNYAVRHWVIWSDSATSTWLCSDTMVKTVTVTNTNIISGHIGQDSLNSLLHVDSPNYKVWLITFDSATNILTAVDSQVVYGNNANATQYQFSGKAAGTYRVKAALLNGPTSGQGWVPTYHYSSLMWNTATTFVHTGSASINKVIVLQIGTATSGPGFIGGNVNQGANKGSGSGIEGMTIFLLDASGKMVASDITDANGAYSFNNLPPANYSIHPEDMGYATTVANAVVVTSKPTITGINFERSSSMKTITPVATAITNVDNSTLGFAIYPNPAKDKISIQWNNTLSNIAEVTLTDITGKQVYANTVSGNGNAVLNLSELNKGMYFITVSTNNVQETKKLLLQ